MRVQAWVCEVKISDLVLSHHYATITKITLHSYLRVPFANSVIDRNSLHFLHQRMLQPGGSGIGDIKSPWHGGERNAKVPIEVRTSCLWYTKK
jgi:hypothetical protein